MSERKQKLLESIERESARLAEEMAERRRERVAERAQRPVSRSPTWPLKTKAQTLAQIDQERQRISEANAARRAVRERLTATRRERGQSRRTARAQSLRRSIKRTIAPYFRDRAQRDGRPGQVISVDSARRRRDLLMQCGDTLHALGYDLVDPTNLRQRHIQALCDHWVEMKLSAGRIANLLSALRWFSEVQGRPNVVPDVKSLFADERYYKRPSNTDRDKSWSGADVSLLDIYVRLYEKEPMVAEQLLLQAAFGLRVQESHRLIPGVDDQGDVLHVHRGAKNGRSRIVPITHIVQRLVLDRARMLVPAGASMIPWEYSARQWYCRYYNVLRACGITKSELGVTSHGLRHEYLGGLYEWVSGLPRPVRLVEPVMDPAERADDRRWRAMVSEAAGHSRPYVTGAYIGGMEGRVPRPRKAKASSEILEALHRLANPLASQVCRVTSSEGDPE